MVKMIVIDVIEKNSLLHITLFGGVYDKDFLNDNKQV